MISYNVKAYNPRTPSKYSYGFKNLETDDLTMISVLISNRVWSPIVWKNGKRDSANFIASNFLALDFDESDMTLDTAVNNVFCDQIHIIGTTKSHQIHKNRKLPCDRYRVVLKLDGTITDLDQYIGTISPLITHYGADESGKDGARFFYPCQDIISIGYDGYSEAIVPVAEVAAKPINTSVIYDDDWLRIDDVLKTISPDVGYYDWLRVGMALCSTDKEWALQVWNEWSKNGKKYRIGECEKKWKTFGKKGLTIASLFHLAADLNRKN